MLKHIGLSEFSSRAGDDTHFTSNWGGWTALNRDPQQDYGNVRNAFSDKTVHEDDFLLFHAFDGEPGLFVDVGANMGFSAISLRNVNKTFAVLSFEVVPFLAPVLALVARDVADFEFEMTGMSDHNRDAILYVPVYKHLMCTPLASFSAENFELDHRQEGWRKCANGAEFELLDVPVRVETLDSLGLAPRIIKIDVEGAEMAALRGMRGTLLSHRPILMCERNEDPEFLTWPAELGFGSYTYVAAQNQMRRFDGPIPSLNVFFLHPDRVADLRARGVDVC